MAQDTFDAFEQVQCKYPHVADMVEAFAEAHPADDESGREWLVAWDDGSSRTTGMAGLAWYAEQFDDEATVTAL